MDETTIRERRQEVVSMIFETFDFPYTVIEDRDEWIVVSAKRMLRKLRVQNEEGAQAEADLEIDFVDGQARPEQARLWIGFDHFDNVDLAVVVEHFERNDPGYLGASRP